MKQLQNNFTTVEQSKRLLELGVPADSADMYIPEGCTPYVFVQGNTYSKAMKNWGLNICDNRVTPCWSVGRLIEMWEICVGVKFDRWSRKGVLLPLIEDCIEHIEFALNPYTKVELDFSKLEE